MALTPSNFSDIITYSRAGGATRFNASGKLVGVDFSATSLTVGTGSKAFTLTADADVDRDWAVGSAVIAVAQEGATGTMTGTVASYVPSTQVLTITVASVTGSGTGTAWRIGNREARMDFDPVTLAPKGLLVEEARTNLYTNSGDFVTKFTGNSGVSVSSSQLDLSGSTKASLVTQDLSTGLHRLWTSVNGGVLSTNTKYSLSLFAKSNGNNKFLVNIDGTSNSLGFGATFDLGAQSAIANTAPSGAGATSSAKITSVGNGWFLCEIIASTGGTFTSSNLIINLLSSGGAMSFTGDGSSGLYLFGAQLEAGSFPTSYIPTTTAQVTRAADAASVDNLSPWYLQSGGTLYVELGSGYTGVSGPAYPISLSNDASNFLGINAQESTAYAVAVSGGATQANIFAGTYPSGPKFCYAFGKDDFAMSVNGSTATFDSNGTMPDVSRLVIGNYTPSAVVNLKMHIRKIGFRPERVSNANLQAVTNGTVDFFASGSLA